MPIKTGKMKITKKTKEKKCVSHVARITFPDIIFLRKKLNL